MYSDTSPTAFFYILSFIQIVLQLIQLLSIITVQLNTKIKRKRMAEVHLDNFPSLFSLDGKVAVVTGGSRGLGLHAASGYLTFPPLFYFSSEYEKLMK